MNDTSLTETEAKAFNAPMAGEEAKPQWPVISVAGNSGRWSNVRTPKIGDRVAVTFNGLGTGKIILTFSEAGYLGVVVMPDAGQRPQWHIDQFKRNKREFSGYRVFGAEVKFLD